VLTFGFSVQSAVSMRFEDACQGSDRIVNNVSAEDWDVLSRTIWGEARGELFLGQVAVAHVIKNRLLTGRWGASFDQVCRWPAQFSCWNDGDPNKFKAMTVQLSDSAFLRAKGIASLVVSGDLPDPTKGATHYFATSIPEPGWAKDMVTTVVLGNHRFLREAQ